MAGEDQRMNVKLSASTHAVAAKEALRWKLSIQDYTDAAVRYFATRKLNPQATVAREGELIMGQVHQVGERVFRYLKEQERGIHAEVLSELVRTRVTQERTLQMLTAVVGRLNNWSPSDIHELLLTAQKEIDIMVDLVLTDLQKAAPIAGKRPTKITE